MPKSALYLATWFAAGVLAVTLASVGVSMVTDQVTGSRPAPLSSQQVQEALAAPSADPTQGSGTGSSTTTTVADRTAATAADPGRSGSTGTGETGGGSAPVTTTTIAPSTGGGPGPTTTVPSTPPTTAPATTRSYELDGGSVTLRFTPSRVTVLVATPRAGFSVEVSEAHSNGARVEFRSDDHRSRVDAWWDGGPQDEVREES